jgi:hypothetical protein
MMAGVLQGGQALLAVKIEMLAQERFSNDIKQPCARSLRRPVASDDYDPRWRVPDLGWRVSRRVRSTISSIATH